VFLQFTRLLRFQQWLCLQYRVQTNGTFEPAMSTSGPEGARHNRAGRPLRSQEMIEVSSVTVVVLSVVRQTKQHIQVGVHL